jgi:hypothetical protein
MMTKMHDMPFGVPRLDIEELPCWEVTRFPNGWLIYRELVDIAACSLFIPYFESEAEKSSRKALEHEALREMYKCDRALRRRI